MDIKETFKENGLTTEYAAAGIVITCLILLWVIRRGFRGINVGGVSVSVK